MMEQNPKATEILAIINNPTETSTGIRNKVRIIAEYQNIT